MEDIGAAVLPDDCRRRLYRNEMADAWNELAKSAVEPRSSWYDTRIDKEFIERNYIPIPMGVSDNVRVTIITAMHLDARRKPVAKEVCFVNLGHEEMGVASLIAWLMMLEEEIYKWVIDVKLHLVPMSKWNEKVIPLLTWSRLQFSVGLEDREKDIKIVDSIRKIGNLMGRNLDEADWEKEKSNMDPAKHQRKTRNCDYCGRREYYRMLRDELGKIASEAVRKTIEKYPPDGIKTFWATRRNWMPSGSSSNRHSLDLAIENDRRITKQDRPNKRSVAEAVDSREFVDVLLGIPRVIARASTKHEPGHKARALYAEDDWSSYISSYASQDMERALDDGEMLAQQLPSDIANWVTAHNYKGDSNRMWLSLDYPDFNKEHRNWELALVNLMLAKEWIKHIPALKGIAKWKAFCAIWTAKAHCNAWVSWKNENYYRVVGGLFSGHRNTARDNTMLHAAYSRIARRVACRDTGEVLRPIYMGICGDDEDGLWKSWEHARLYAAAHWLIGWNLNVKKQLCGTGVHEFLQGIFCYSRLPTRPLASMVATCCSGNWYKMAGHHYNEMIQNVSDLCWNMVSRGARIRTCRMAAIYILDQCYKTYGIGGKTKRIEWWRYRNGENILGHPLWGGAEFREWKPMAIEEIELRRGMPEKATQDWLNYHGKLIRISQSDEIGRYKRNILQEAHKSLYKARSEKMRIENAREQLESRVNNGNTTGDVCGPFNERKIFLDMVASELARRPSSLEKTLAGLNMDIQLFNAVGGWKNIALAYGKDKLKHCNRDVEMLKPTQLLRWNDPLWRVDPAVRTVIMNRNLSS